MIRTNLSITQIQYCLAVARHRSFSAAARECRVTQPTLSMQVQKLESDLDIVLFDRSKVPTQLTEAGKRILGQFERTLSEFEKVYDLAANETQGVSGEIRIAFIPTVGPYIIPRFAKQISDRYPELRLHIEELQTHEILAGLKSHSVDLGVLVTPLDHESVVETPLFYEKFVIYAHPEHGLAKKSRVDESELSPGDVWLLREGHCFRDQAIRICLGRKSRPPRNIELEAGDFSTIRRIVDEAGGYTLLPEMALVDLTDHEIRASVRHFGNPSPTREISLVHSETFGRKKISNAVIEALKDIWGGHDHLDPKKMKRIKMS